MLSFSGRSRRCGRCLIFVRNISPRQNLFGDFPSNWFPRSFVSATIKMFPPFTIPTFYARIFPSTVKVRPYFTRDASRVFSTSPAFTRRMHIAETNIIDQAEKGSQRSFRVNQSRSNIFVDVKRISPVRFPDKTDSKQFEKGTGSRKVAFNTLLPALMSKESRATRKSDKKHRDYRSDACNGAKNHCSVGQQSSREPRLRDLQGISRGIRWNAIKMFAGSRDGYTHRGMDSDATKRQRGGALAMCTRARVVTRGACNTNGKGGQQEREIPV